MTRKPRKTEKTRSVEKEDIMAVPKQGFVVAIDGPAGTGKSSVTRRLADILGFTHIDTGALYRAVALELSAKKKKESTAQAHAEAAIKLARTLHLEFRRVPDRNPANRIFVDSKDVTDYIRTPEVSMAASRISSIPGVRAALLGLQRRMGCVGNSILEGRDIGTVVFPDADVKFFLTASVDERAKRRLAELEATGADAPSFEEVRQQISARDDSDTRRAVAPLKKAKDAIEVDTSNMTLDEVVESMQKLIRGRLGLTPKGKR